MSNQTATPTTKRRNPERFYAGSPERGGQSSFKLVIHYGPGSKPPTRRKFHEEKPEFAAAMQARFGLQLVAWSDPFFSYDWANGRRRSKGIDEEKGYRGLQALLRKHVALYDVQYAVIAESNFKGKLLEHWTPGKQWMQHDDFMLMLKGKQAGEATHTCEQLKAWVCLDAIGQHHRNRMKHKSANPIFYSQDKTNVTFAIQSLVNQCQTLVPDWVPYLLRIKVYQEDGNLEIGSIQYKQDTRTFAFVPTHKKYKEVWGQVKFWGDVLADMEVEF